MEDVTPATPDNAQQANPQTDAGSAVDGSGQNDGKADGQAATASEQSFTHVDPKTLPPALKAVYDNMLRDYTKKTMSISDRVKSEAAKATEAFKAKAEMFDKLSANEEFVKRWNDYVQEVSKVGQDGQNPPDEVKQKLHELEMKFKATESLEAINAFADAKNEKGEMLHPEFDKLSAFKIGNHQQSGEYDLLRAAIELAPGNSTMEKLENGYKAAKAVYDQIFEEGKKAGMGRLNEKARNGSMSPSQGSGQVSGVASKRPANALEALEMAKRGLQPAR
jgi:hypothetical protein